VERTSGETEDNGVVDETGLDMCLWAYMIGLDMCLWAYMMMSMMSVREYKQE